MTRLKAAFDSQAGELPPSSAQVLGARKYKHLSVWRSVNSVTDWSKLPAMLGAAQSRGWCLPSNP